mgnify:CR=1 FL=1
MAAALWLAPGDRMLLTAMLAGAAITDILDGTVARYIRRRRLERGADPESIGESHAVGAWLDPVCDKIFVVSAILSIWFGWSVPLWLIAMIGLRELIVTPVSFIYLFHRGMKEKLHFDFRASKVGKAATVAQFVAALSIVYLPEISVALAVTAAVVGAAAAVSYFRRAIKTARFVSNNAIVFARWLELQDELHG